jgi:hypothetical protein
VIDSLILMCAVCFRGAEPAARDSLNAGILVLLGVTGAVLCCFAAFFVRLARRARTAAPVLAGDDVFDFMDASLRPPHLRTPAR